MTTHPIQLPRDAQTATSRELRKLLERLWVAEPGLRPNPDMHDYQLTYPPAVQIQTPRHRGAPTPEQFRELAIGDFRAAGYYFHFGFCVYRCRYCFHYELTTKRNSPGGGDRMARYVDALGHEMRTFKALNPDLRTGLYFLGGGTPTALPTNLIERFLTNLLDTFGPVPTSLSTVESKPITATREKLELLRNAGFRRINFGVQTLNPELYAFHHHDEDVRVALDAITRARELGFDYVNIDLMIGIERQTRASWRTTLTALERLIDKGAVDSVFIYPYHDDPRSRTYAHTEALPPFHEVAFSEASARAMLERKGWKELGARFWRSPRHVRRELFELAKTRINPAYGEVLYHGFGNSSFSIGDRASYLNLRSLEEYCAAVEGGKLGIGHWMEIDDAQRATRDVTFDLLYSPVTRVRSREQKYGREVMTKHREQLERWVALGLGKWNRLTGTFSLTGLGKLVHLQMIPRHYLENDWAEFAGVMNARRELGRRYRGY
jgi:oxygen-independent coproporphyrinogen-3 oxidase